MPNYKRRYGGDAYFFTIVTWHRLAIFNNDKARECHRQAWKIVEERHPFTTLTVCLLPDHIHAIWTLPESDDNYSIRWKEIKRQFTLRYFSESESEYAITESRRKRGEAGIWQRRFGEHTITNSDDLSMHIDYIHFNPVKHGLVKSAREWRWSSFHRYVANGHYDENWGKAIEYWGNQDFGDC
jgi:putative transposase